MLTFSLCSHPYRAREVSVLVRNRRRWKCGRLGRSVLLVLLVESAIGDGLKVCSGLVP